MVLGLERMPDGICPIGSTTGFPVIVQSLTSATTTVNPNDLVLQFDINSSLCTFNEGAIYTTGINTFFLGGSQYTLADIRICNPVITSFETNTPIAQIIFWGQPSANSSSKANLAALIVPIYRTGEKFVSLSLRDRQATTTLSNLWNLNAKSIQADLPTLFPENEVYRYTTCIEVIDGANIRNTSIAVAYWSKGIALTVDTPSPPSAMVSFGIPGRLLSGRAAGSFNSSVDPKTVSNPSYQNDGQSTPYTTTLNATTSEYKNRFTKMLFTQYSTTAKTGPSTQDLKCITIERSSDIVNGHLVVDPATGKRLDQEISSEEQQDLDLNKETPSVVYPADIERWIAIVLGTIVGLLALAIVIILGSHLLGKDTKAKIEAAAVVAAAAAAAPPIKWVDYIMPIGMFIIFVCMSTITIVAIIYSSKS